MTRRSWLVASLLASASAAFVACAAAEEDAAKDGRDTVAVPDGGETASDGGTADGCTDADVCAPVFDCTQVDFCPTEFPVSRLVALNAIWGSGPNDVWAVGTRGTVLHGDGSKFTPVSVDAGTATDIYVAVWGTSSTDVWILGPSFPLHASGHGSAFEPRQGSSWDGSKTATGRLWAGTSAGPTAPDTVWLAGESSTRFGTASSFWALGSDANDAPVWLPDSCTGAKPCLPAVRALWAADASTAWAVGHDGRAFVWETSSEADAGTPRWIAQNSNTRDDLEAVWGSGPDDVWAVGRRGTIRHTARGSSVWTVITSPTTNDLHAVWGSGPNDVWAAGDIGTILHYDGTSWSLATLALPNGDTPTNLFGIWGSSQEDVWIVGEGLILHRTATSGRQP